MGISQLAQILADIKFQPIYLYVLFHQFSDACYKVWPVGHIVNAVKDTGEEEEEEEGIFEWEMDASYYSVTFPR